MTGGVKKGKAEVALIKMPHNSRPEVVRQGLPDFRRIADFAVKNGLPTITYHTPYLQAGLLILYGANMADQYRHAGIYVDKILRGAKPADLPVEQPTKIDLTINRRTARALGLKIPETLLERADLILD